MLKVKVYADGADLDQMVDVYKEGTVKGFTTNPSLMKSAGVTDYNAFAKKVVKAIPDMSISFEVFGDDFDTMEKEARKISTFGENVFVKIPIMNTKGESSIPLIEKLSADGINLNVTAIFTVDQVREVVEVVSEDSNTIVSVFAGRIADTGVDPMGIMRESEELCHSKENIELLWASCREVLNIIQADEVGCDIITVPNSIIAKMDKLGKDLEEYSLDTVKGFASDIEKLGYSIL